MSANRYFRYSANSKRAVSRFDHQGSVFHLRRDHRIGNQRHVGKLMRELGHGARHVPVRGHHDQRIEIVLARPALGLDGVAEGVERGAVEIDAAGEKFGIERGQPGDFARAGGAVHAADQQPLAALGRQQLDGVGNARGGPGQHHDAVGIAVELHFLARNGQHEPAESAAQQHRAGGAGGHGEKADHSVRDLRACQSIVSRVRLTVCREVIAVTSAISTTWPARRYSRQCRWRTSRTAPRSARPRRSRQTSR